ncbi:MAG: ABC transporter substrate-binding protein [Chloroflexi bacterium]|nr:ABC transporter substrate-binding protein [Chloroflexota bacterium]
MIGFRSVAAHIHGEYRSVMNLIARGKKLPMFLVLLTMLLAVAAVACSGGDDDADPTAAAQQPTAAAQQSTVAAQQPTAAAQQPKATSAPTQSKFNGNLRLGEIVIDAPVFLPSKQGTGNSQLLGFWGFFESMMYAKYSAPPDINLDEPTYNLGLVESWTVASDTSKVTFKIRKGVQFHHGWGEVTAEDIAWSFDNAMSEGSINQRAQGVQQFATDFEATDSNTIVMTVKDNLLNPQWFKTLSNTTLGTIWVTSKKQFDQDGEEAATINPVGTGPFEITEWVTDDHVKAVPVENHYRKEPSVASFEVLLMPEPAIRIAALKTGQIDAARVPLKLISNTVADIDGARSQVVGPAINQVVMFAGNYWAEIDRNDGSDIKGLRPGFKPDADHPWIGDPDDAESMDNANKVRRALRLAIDRQLIVDEVQSGIGRPLTNVINAFPGDPHWRDAFAVDYDLDQAKELLSEAGYADCFPFTLHVAPGKEWDVSVGGAVAQFWRELGCEVEVDATDYGAARPRLVNRQKEIPWMIQSGTNASPDAFSAASVFRPSGGFNYGIEVPNEISEIAEKNQDVASTTFDQRVQNNVDWWTYVNDWNLVASVSTLPTSVVLGPEIVEYSPYMNDGPEFVAPETVVMK